MVVRIVIFHKNSCGKIFYNVVCTLVFTSISFVIINNTTNIRKEIKRFNVRCVNSYHESSEIPNLEWIESVFELNHNVRLPGCKICNYGACIRDFPVFIHLVDEFFTKIVEGKNNNLYPVINYQQFQQAWKPYLHY